MGNWYPENKEELSNLINNYFSNPPQINTNKIKGLIVPHAGYEYSGKIAGKAFSLLKNKNIKKAIILGPSHYISLSRAVTSDKFSWNTPLGEVKLFNTGFQTSNIEQEHSIKNQIPFLQKLGINEVMPIMVGEILKEESYRIAQKLSKENAIFIISTDLSHFMHYDMANKIDNTTINIIKNLDLENYKNIDACGFYPLLITINLCKILGTKPQLIEYKNSGDITGDKKQGVVGYSSFYF
ncbi:AmmeMemoRadiSam system protein B [Candidatus Pacearchaeota archaeon]|nr:AmmeMemoRadiSam system protein B [Candidatus Pacearchaeota archaeon]